MEDAISITIFNMHGFNNSWKKVQDLLKNSAFLAVQEHWHLTDTLHYLEGLSKSHTVFSVPAMGNKITKNC